MQLHELHCIMSRQNSSKAVHISDYDAAISICSTHMTVALTHFDVTSNCHWQVLLHVEFLA